LSHDVVCLRPEADFTRAGVKPSPALTVAYRAPCDPDVSSLLAKARALVIPAVGPALAPELFREASLSLVQVTGAGLDRLHEPTLRSKGIAVANVPGGSNAAVAEYVVTTASFLLRRFGWADAQIRAGRYAEGRAKLLADNVGGVEGLLVGIVGMGTIGRAVARAFVNAGARIAFYDPAMVNGSALPFEARAMPLDDLIAACDVLSLHVPLVAETKGLIGARQLASMKKGAVLVQAARGGIVDERALAESLRTGHLGAAAVDVYSTEPLAPDNPLLALEGDAAWRILFTPHIAGVTRQSAAFLFRSAWENVERVVVRGEPPLHRVY
jgi:phosphoglycerate dehydrogenase-like enzyme